MPVMRTYQCPDCQGVFDHLHMRSTDEPPAFCPLCGANTSSVQPELSAPHVAKSIGKVADNVYRQMEAASEHRAELAAEALGSSVSDMSAMKITDTMDNARIGESSAPKVDNAVSRMMQQTGVGGMQGSEAASQFAADVRSGPFANAGAKAMQGVRQSHSQRAARVAAAGNMGSFAGSK